MAPEMSKEELDRIRARQQVSASDRELRALYQNEMVSRDPAPDASRPRVPNGTVRQFKIQR